MNQMTSHPSLLLTREVLLQFASAEYTYNRVRPKGMPDGEKLSRGDFKRFYDVLTYLGGTYNLSGRYFEFNHLNGLVQLRQYLAPVLFVVTNSSVGSAFPQERLAQIRACLDSEGKAILIFDAGDFSGSLIMCGRGASATHCTETRQPLQVLLKLFYNLAPSPLSLVDVSAELDVEIMLGRYKQDAPALHAFRILKPGGKLGLIIPGAKLPESLYGGLCAMGKARLIEIKPLGRDGKFSLLVITKDVCEASHG